MAQGVRSFITNDGGILSTSIDGGRSRMTKTEMPQTIRGGKPSVRDGAAQARPWARATGAPEQGPKNCRATN
jgi:hypothetical protein